MSEIAIRTDKLGRASSSSSSRTPASAGTG